MQSGTRKASREKYRGFSMKPCPNHLLQQINPKGENSLFSENLYIGQLSVWKLTIPI